MVDSKKTAQSGPAVVEVKPQRETEAQRASELDAARKSANFQVGATNDGGKGPPSALEGGTGSFKDRGYNDDGTPAKGKGQSYAVQVHTAEKGLEVVYVTAENGDDAANKALAQRKYLDTSIRGVTPASDPDPNSLGGEREAAAMIKNAINPGAIINTLGTEANIEATRKLGVADIKSLND